MKTAIVYYSLSGNTEYVAKTIAGEIGADLIRIEPEKAYPSRGAKKFFWGGKSSVMEEKPRLVPYEFDLTKYDRIIIGTPVWAGNFVPPIRTFLCENKELVNKKLAVFLCFSGGGAEKALDKMKNQLGISSFEAELILVDPKVKKKSEDDEKIKRFCEALGKDEITL